MVFEQLRDISISIGNLETQSHTVENINTVGFLSDISVDIFPLSNFCLQIYLF